MKPHILLVEDDDELREALGDLLGNAGGYRVTQAENGEQAIAFLGDATFDVVITDIRLGSTDGIQVMHAAKNLPLPPVIMLLTAYGSLDTAIEAVRAGAYDYMLKPTNSQEFLARVAQAVQRRQIELRQARVNKMITRCATEIYENPLEPVEPFSAHSQQVADPSFVYVGPLCIDYDRHQVFLHEQPLNLTPTEYTLLTILTSEPERVWKYQEIVQQTHNLKASATEARELLRTHIHNLRHKIGPQLIVGVRGVGYMFVGTNSEEG
jgi:DNA-binding response OmpR family regulator